MFILTYYDEKKCLISPIGSPFIELEKGQQLLKDAVTQQLEIWDCHKSKEFFERAQKERNFCLDLDSDIELYVEPCVVYMKTESREPFFLTFQILQLNQEYPSNPSSGKMSNTKI